MEEEIPEVISADGVRCRTKVLAYLGQLHPGEFIPVKKLIHDLSLRFTTAKNVLTALEEEWIVEKKIVNNRGIIASFRIMPTAVTVKSNSDGQLIPYVPPEWEPIYGKHPYGL